MIRTILIALALTGCTATGQLTPQAAATLQVVCAVDPAAYAAGQTIATTISVQGVSNAATIDAALVHPLVVAACAGFGSKPVAVGKG